MSMPPSNLHATLEALLFSSDQPLPLALLADTVDLEPAQVAEALVELGARYHERDGGIEMREIAGGWLLVTRADQSDWVGKLLRGKRRMRLSRAALETMAIIAYKQPVTKSEVEAIRGVDSSAVLATLLERNLVTIRGRSKVVGRPLLYGTTQEFLEYFGLKDLAELPRPEELRALVAAREPEQLDMMEVEVVSQVATDLAAGEAAGTMSFAAHEMEPYDGDPKAEVTDQADASLLADAPLDDDEESALTDDEFEDDDEDEASLADEFDEDDDDDDDDDEDEDDAGDDARADSDSLRQPS
jgi:segregation and condensation protein B